LIDFGLDGHFGIVSLQSHFGRSGDSPSGFSVSFPLDVSLFGSFGTDFLLGACCHHSRRGGVAADAFPFQL
jgi:hypothetical protein